MLLAKKNARKSTAPDDNLSVRDGRCPGRPTDFPRWGADGDFDMKKIALAAALSMAATTAFAGGMAEPIMEEPVIEEKAASTSAGGIIVPLLVLLLVAAAASN